MKDIVEPRVKLLEYTPNPERSIYVAARLCYASLDIDEIEENIDPAAIPKLIRFLIAAGHHSALEHASFTFAVEDVSRALTHQLVRHRLASYNQQSLRYVAMDSQVSFVVPPSIAENPKVLEKYREMVDAQSSFYGELVAQGIPKEDARYVIGQGVASKIIVTMNARELLNFFEHRICHRAQWEIQLLAQRMLELVEPLAPTVFELAGPECVRSKCSEGKMGCGRPYPRKVVA